MQFKKFTQFDKQLYAEEHFRDKCLTLFKFHLVFILKIPSKGFEIQGFFSYNMNK